MPGIIHVPFSKAAERIATNQLSTWENLKNFPRKLFCVLAIRGSWQSNELEGYSLCLCGSLALTELQQQTNQWIIRLKSLLAPHLTPLDGSTSPWHTNHSTQFCVTCRLAVRLPEQPDRADQLGFCLQHAAKLMRFSLCFRMTSSSHPVKSKLGKISAEYSGWHSTSHAVTWAALRLTR